MVVEKIEPILEYQIENKNTEKKFTQFQNSLLKTLDVIRNFLLIS